MSFSSCNHFQCPIDCKLSGWTAFSACSKTCGGGTKKRTKSVVNTALYGGAKCPNDIHYASCNHFQCPIDCRVSAWTAFTACSATCATGTKRRSRSILTVQAHGGATCPMLKEYKTCASFPCPVDCKVSKWNAFGACSVTCGTGSKTKSRSIITDVKHGGVTCPALSSSVSC